MVMERERERSHRRQLESGLNRVLSAHESRPRGRRRAHRFRHHPFPFRPFEPTTGARYRRDSPRSNAYPLRLVPDLATTSPESTKRTLNARGFHEDRNRREGDATRRISLASWCLGKKKITRSFVSLDTIYRVLRRFS